jgi:hypothetical protein
MLCRYSDINKNCVSHTLTDFIWRFWAPTCSVVNSCDSSIFHDRCLLYDASFSIDLLNENCNSPLEQLKPKYCKFVFWKVHAESRPTPLIVMLYNYLFPTLSIGLFLFKTQRSSSLNQTPHTGNNKESSHMCLIEHPISQPSLDISPNWTPIIAADVKKLQLLPV